MDVISLFKSGIKNAVACMGTALTMNHAKDLKRFSDKVILCFDGDQAGINATAKAASVFASENKIPYAVQLPEGLDPDEYLKKYGNE